MANQHAFRFGVINEQTAAPDAWIAQVRRVEAWGYSTFLIRDHFAPDYFGDQFAPFAALTAAACATKPRCGTAGPDARAAGLQASKVRNCAAMPGLIDAPTAGTPGSNVQPRFGNDRLVSLAPPHEH